MLKEYSVFKAGDEVKILCDVQANCALHPSAYTGATGRVVDVLEHGMKYRIRIYGMEYDVPLKDLGRYP